MTSMYVSAMSRQGPLSGSMSHLQVYGSQDPEGVGKTYFSVAPHRQTDVCLPNVQDVWPRTDIPEALIFDKVETFLHPEQTESPLAHKEVEEETHPQFLLQPREDPQLATP